MRKRYFMHVLSTVFNEEVCCEGVQTCNMYGNLPETTRRSQFVVKSRVFNDIFCDLYVML